MIPHFGGWVDAEAPENGGSEVSGSAGGRCGKGTDSVARAIDRPALNPSTHEQNAGAFGPMVAAGGGIDFRGAAKFPCHHNKG